MGMIHDFTDECGRNRRVDLEIPGQCPFCARFITPTLRDTNYFLSDDRYKSSMMAYWSCNGCAQVFAVRYNLVGTWIDVMKCNIDSLCPPLLSLTAVDERIQQVSSRFVDLLRQAETAKANGLTDIAGMGFRKALECLLKDALVFLGRKTHDEVCRMSLANAVASFSDNPRLKKASDNARVLGNEYTHYETRYEGYDLDTLQKLISVALHWLTMELETAELADDPSQNWSERQ